MLCLALSGGGIRSAAFSIGVLRGLYERHVLDSIDVISSVSGGSYALSWYYAQHWIGAHQNGEQDRAATDARLFENPAAIDYLAQNASVTPVPMLVASGAGNLLLIPWNAMVNGLFGSHSNTTLERPLYQHRLSQIFLTQEPGRFSGETDLSNFKEFTKNRHLPFFVLNSTALVEVDGSYYGGRLGNSVFEFTPLQFGSDAFGRWNYHKNAVSLGRAVSISGAAVDTDFLVPGAGPKILSSAANFDLGFYFPNPNVMPSRRFLHDLIPFPFYFVDRYDRDANATKLYLSDGGFAENLGVYSLVARGCQNIIAVDAEYDPFYQFESYHRLKNGLKSQLQVDLKIDEIDSVLSKLQIPGEEARKEPQTADGWRLTASKPVMTGSISGLPIKGVPSKVISVTYIKLSYQAPDPKCADEHPRYNVVERYYCQRLAQRHSIVGNLLKYDPFPQESTTEQNYSVDRFAAYVQLGHDIVREKLLLPEDLTRKGVNSN
jgi:hypothetical protein